MSRMTWGEPRRLHYVDGFACALLAGLVGNLDNVDAMTDPKIERVSVLVHQRDLMASAIRC